MTVLIQIRCFIQKSAAYFTGLAYVSEAFLSSRN